MLSAREAWGTTHLDPTTWANPNISPTRASVVAGPIPEFIAIHLSKKLSGNFEDQDLLLVSPRGDMAGS